MRTFSILFCSSVLFASAALAAPTTAPAEGITVPVPTNGAPAPTTAPAAGVTVPVPINVASAPAAAPMPETQPVEAGTILILPFSETSGAAFPWIGKGIQDDLAADLSRSTRAHVVAPANAPPAMDAQAAVESAHHVHATTVVFGQFQSTGREIRFTGQILDADSGKPLGGISATGPISNLFPSEDAVSLQVLRALPSGWVTVALPSANGSPSVNTPAPAASEPGYYSYIYPDHNTPPDYYAQAHSYYYPDYGYAYPSYPYYDYGYGYGYPFLYGGLFYGGYWGHHWGYGRGYHGGFYHGAGGGSYHGGGGGGFHGGGGGGHAGGGGGHR